jgi:predicted GIY-YIG superfamily endonuclease
MPAWAPLLKAFLASPAGKGAIWLLDKVGLKPLVDWAAKAVEKGVTRIGNRHKAIRKAGHTINGRWAAVVVEDRARWVVYSDLTPVEIFPAIQGDLASAMQTFDVARLRDPDHVPTARARAWAKARLARMFGGRGAEAEAEADTEPETQADAKAAEKDAETSPQTVAIRDALATSGAVGGQAVFHRMVDDLPALLERLSSALAMSVRDHNGIAEEPGVYLFTDGVTPIYVGQTRNLRSRLRQHTSPSSRENQAALAWRIALSAAADAGHTVSGTRKTLEADEQFAEHFRSAKERVAAMDVRFVEINDPVTRTVFEVYAARALGTDEFNSWDTH